MISDGPHNIFIGWKNTIYKHGIFKYYYSIDLYVHYIIIVNLRNVNVSKYQEKI
jgi:hypothetical protein